MENIQRLLIRGALGKDDRIFSGDLDVDACCAPGACVSPTLFEGLDDTN